MILKIYTVAVVVFALPTSLAIAQGNKSEADKLAAVLGESADKWRMTWRNGGKHDYSLAEFEGKPLMRAGPNATILGRLDPVAVDTEVTLRFRLDIAAKKEIWFWLDGGLKKLDEDASPLRLGLRWIPSYGQEVLFCAMPALPGQKHGLDTTYTIRSLPPDKKSWPEFVRARAEADFESAATLGERWLTVRYVLRKNRCRVYLDDRLLREMSDPKLETAGHLKFTLFEGVQLGSIRIRALPPEDPLFEPIDLASYLNATKFRGTTFARESLPEANKLTKVGNVPFVLPAPDAKGNDHIDLRPSWLRVGLLEGGFDGSGGALSRWGGALHRDAGRICFRVPNARYRALHLLATYDGEADTIPVVTAQFYRPNAGFPVNFSGRVPLFSAQAKAEALPFKLKDGKAGRLYLVTIPLEPEGLDSLADLDHLEFELTKEVTVHRSYPDPIYYSQHQAGLPSGVHVFAITLERPEIDVTIEPAKVAHIWTAPEVPTYVVKFRDALSKERKLTLFWSADSLDDLGLGFKTRPLGVSRIEIKNEKQKDNKPQTAFNWTQEIKIEDLRIYGIHRLDIEIEDSQGKRTRTRSFAYLHRDTRERGGWEEGKGPIFGFWDWGGGHVTPGGLDRLKVMAAAGVESTMQSFQAGELYPAEEKAFAEKHGMQSFFLAYQLSMGKHSLGIDWDPKKPVEMEKALIATMKKSPMLTRSKINKPELAVFFAEPVLGPISYMSLPQYYGEPPYSMTAEEEKNYQNYRDQFVTAARAIKREWPEAKCLMPWGLPLFPAAFLKDKEARDLMDGPALDVVLFERLPEMQLHQVTLSSQLWQLKQEWTKAGKKWPNFTSLEGPCVGPNLPGSLTSQQEADHTVRALLVLAAYGTTRHLGWPTPFHCAGSWGESHYGSGLCERLPILSPKPVYAAYATLTRQLNRMNFVKVVATGSHSVFCLQFKHYKTGELLHVFWTLRGSRPVTVTLPKENKVEVFSSMDNVQQIDKDGEKATFKVSSSPCYVRGLKGEPRITLGEPDHSDAKRGPHAVALGDLGDGTWKLSDERDADYEGSHPEFVRRFPGKMTAKPARGGLAVHMEKQEKERKTMPFYTSLVPAKPITIAGKASHLGLSVKASSDWGRVVYCLRDAKGERWLSVGKKGEWNVDDVHCWSAFCFDGWRYLTFEMPGNSPWDGYREAGTSFWGPNGKGDGMVDLPLTLEKIIVERRTHVIAPTEQFPADHADVILGSLHAEYAKEADRGDEAIRLSRLRMPAR